MADGMWIIHLFHGLWVALGLGAGLWFCVSAFEPGVSPSTQRALVITGSVLAFAIAIPFLIVWRDLTRPITLYRDRMRIGKKLVPYETVISLENTALR